MHNHSHDHDDHKEGEHDLRAENDRLAAEIRTRGGVVERFADLDPALEGLFLRQVLAHEETEPTPLRSLFPELDAMPAPEQMDEVHLAFRLDEVKSALARHGIELALQPGVPAAVAYRFLVEDYIPSGFVPDGVDDGFTTIVDGCSGWCDEPCFQRKYCDHTCEEG